ncbi:MAG: response regulator transcription factor [Filimonas sp.]|nr:response regulator transcription factor [Filimonas sp.]
MEQKAKQTYHIMIVEDDKYMRFVLQQYLQTDFQVDSFDNGLDALKYLQDGNIPDIIITDLKTPKLSGLELLQQVKASGFFNSIPVMVVSGDDSTEKRIQCLNAGADDFVVKPFNPAELSARLNVILRRSGKQIQS